MRIASIELEWFRGAADSTTLPLRGKSVVVYGPNGAGKSSFVDAIEYLLCAGKIGHLTHEYSGKKQEKGVINTHKPTLKPTRASLQFIDDTSATVNVSDNGAYTATGEGLRHVADMEYRRVVLRQDEVAAFIGSPKGEKYSALLPLLGLEELEFAAENVRQLAKRVAKGTDLDRKKEALESALDAAKHALAPGETVSSRVDALHAKYRSATPREDTLERDCDVLTASIRGRVEALAPDIQRYEALRNLAAIKLESLLDEVDRAEAALESSAVRLLQQRIAVIENASALLRSDTAEEVQCPACGRAVNHSDLSAHLSFERDQLEAERAVLDTYNVAIDALFNGVASVKSAASSPAFIAWWTARQTHGEADVTWLRELQPVAIRGPAGSQVRQVVRNRLLPMMREAESHTRNAPTGNKELLSDWEAARAAKAILATSSLALEVAQASLVMAHLTAVEISVRSAIRSKSDAVIADISTDIQRMWGVLHPGHEVEDVRLKHPDETDKAIDIELKFFGVELRSPRLTLSEGNRNSLGLCVFLSMAMRADIQVPVFLDDVVVSLDRDHRGMVVELLEREFAERQVILFTHDRDWFAELRQMLPADWEFHVLMPYTSPDVGIAWSKRVGTFDDARAQLAAAPDTAANIARKIMDNECGLIAEKLRLRMEYRQGLRNDHRMAHEFLESLVKASRVAFHRRNAKGSYELDPLASETLLAADKLLLTWANRGSHTFDVVASEATKLLDACETALELFKCQTCEKAIYKLDDGSATKQCECGALRWRYNKLGK